MEYKRKQFEEVLNRINEPRGRIQIIVGPRQVGKFTLITQVKSGRRTINNGLPKFTETYHPHKSLVVGSGGLSFEEFLTMDLNLLFR